MKKLARYLFTILSVYTAFIIFALPILAAYTMAITVANTGSAYTMLGVLDSLDIDYLITNGYISSNGLDTRVEKNGSAVPHMLVDDKIMFASAVGAGYTGFELTTGNTALTDYYIIPGYGGYVTTLDNAALEPGNNFSITMTDTYVDTTAGLVGSNLFLKSEALRCYVSSTGNLTARMEKFTSPSGTGADAGWVNAANIIDGNTGTAAQYNFTGAPAWSPYIWGTIAATDISGVRYYLGASVDIDQVELSLFYGGGWHTIYTGAYAGGAWQSYDGDYTGVTSYRLRFHDTANLPAAIVWEIDFRTPVLATKAVTSGEYDIIISADAANLSLSVNGVAQTTALGGASTYNNGNNWIWLSNATPYAGRIQESVAGVAVIDYNPATYIGTTVLPDLVGGAQNGAFTWGANPAGVSATNGSLLPETTTTSTSGEETGNQDIAPVVDGDITPDDSTMTGLTNPFYPLAKAITDTTTVPIQFAWGLIAMLSTFGVLAGSIGAQARMGAQKLHLGASLIIASLVLAYWVGSHVITVWFIFLVIAMFIFGIIMERNTAF